MPITRDETCSTQAATLMKALNACCDGHDLQTVEAATCNMFSAAIHNGALMRGVTDADFARYLDHMTEILRSNAMANWNRQPQGSDLPVSGN
jgi:hypothetical protein